MNLELLKKTSKSKVIHRYENVVTSSHRHEANRQCRKHDTDYVNVEYDERNGRRHLAMLGGTTKKVKRSSIDSDLRVSSRETTNTKCTIDRTNSTDGELQHSEFVNGLRVTESKSLRVHHRMNRVDFEGSSSEVTDSVESEDAQKRELEHYNRLKLNWSCLQNNKKLLKGISILYNDAVLVNGKQHSLQAALDSSTLYKQRQQQQYSIAEESSSSSSASSKKYKKEGHINQLLSVTGRPVRHSPLLATSMNSLARSTGDVNAVDTNFQMKNDTTSKKSLTIREKRSKSFSDVETKIATFPEFTSSTDSTTISLEPTHSSMNNYNDLEEKQSTGFDRHTCYPAPSQLTLSQSHRQTLLSVSEEVEIQTPKEIMRPLKTKGETCLATSNYCGIHFINVAETMTFDHSGGQYVSESHDVWITVPKGAIKKHAVAELQIRVTLHGPFSFPDAKRPVSPIILIDMNPKTKLKKPIEITIPHFVDKLGQSQSEELVFLMTTGGTKTGRKCEFEYNFSRVADINKKFITNNRGTIATKDLYCFLCIAGDTSVDSSLAINYCLVPVIPRLISQTTWKIHYYVTYLLKTFIHMLQYQMGQEWEILPPRKLDFATVNKLHVKQRILEIQFQRDLGELGWILSLESNAKIQASDLCLWDRNESNMEVLESMGMYAPRFTIRVHGENARASSVATIHFLGGSEDFITEIPLPLPRINFSTISPSTPTSVFSLNQTSRSSISSSTSDTHNTSACRPINVHGLHSTCKRRFQTQYNYDDYDHLPHMNEIDQIVPDVHNIPSDKELLEVATEITKILKDNWIILQASLSIPDHIMLDVLSQTTMNQQIFRLLIEWRTHTMDCSRDNLAHCLHQADTRLHHVGLMLQPVS